MASTIAKTKTGIGRQAIIRHEIGIFSVQLYNTVVYMEYPESVILNNGGWVTPTTVRYIDQALAYRGIDGYACIRKGEMFFALRSDHKLNPFVDGKYTFQKGA